MIRDKSRDGIEIEQWKYVDDDREYTVSNYGRVSSLDHYVDGKKDTRRLVRGKILSMFVNSSGYRQVTIKGKTVLVSRLVATAFVNNPMPSTYTQVNHINGDKEQNYYTNLEWCTPSGNVQHAYDTGLNSNIIPVYQLDINENLIAKYDSLSAAQRATGISISVISKYLAGKYSTGGGYHWEVVNDVT